VWTDPTFLNALVAITSAFLVALPPTIIAWRTGRKVEAAADRNVTALGQVNHTINSQREAMEAKIAALEKELRGLKGERG
jgi:hypothetical protein